MDAPFRLLFVCLGNICRSPAAEGVMQHLVNTAGLQDRIHVDSAGTAGWHTGKHADSRMIATAAARGYELASRARQVKPEDLQSFDLILAMDRDNLRDLQSLVSAPAQRRKLRLFCDFCTDHEASVVPDPYHGGQEGFDEVLDLLEDGCQNLLRLISAGKDVWRD